MMSILCLFLLTLVTICLYSILIFFSFICSSFVGCVCVFFIVVVVHARGLEKVNGSVTLVLLVISILTHDLMANVSVDLKI